MKITWSCSGKDGQPNTIVGHLDEKLKIVVSIEKFYVTLVSNKITEFPQNKHNKQTIALK